MTWEREKILELQAEIKRLMMKIKRLEAEIERLTNKHTVQISLTKLALADVERLEALVEASQGAYHLKSDAQAKAIDASITAAFYNGMERAAEVVENHLVDIEDPLRVIRAEIAAAIRAKAANYHSSST